MQPRGRVVVRATELAETGGAEIFFKVIHVTLTREKLYTLASIETITRYYDYDALLAVLCKMCKIVRTLSVRPLSPFCLSLCLVNCYATFLCSIDILAHLLATKCK